MTELRQTSVVYKDFDLNFSQNPISKDIGMLTNESAIKQSLKNLLLLNRGDFPFEPSIGCGIKELLFEPLSPLTSSVMAQRIETTIKNEEPRVALVEVGVVPDYGQDGYNIRISFRVNMQQVTSYEMFVSKS